MATPIQYDINIYRGDSYSTDLQIVDEDGIPINLSGYDVSGIIKNNFCATTGIANFDVVIQEPRVSGIFTLSLSPDQTASLPNTVLFYDVRGILDTGHQSHFFGGNLNIYPSVLVPYSAIINNPPTSGISIYVSTINGLYGDLILTGAGLTTVSQVGNIITIFSVASGAVGGGGNVTSVGGLTGVVGLTGAGNVTSYLSGNTVVLSGAGSSQQLNNVVFTTGNQIISGVKFLVDNLASTGVGAANNVFSIISGLFKTNSVSALDFRNRALYDSNDNITLNWDSKITYDANGFASLFWDQRISWDSNSKTSLGWQSRFLYDTGGSVITVDWANRVLSGNWSTNTFPVTSGHIINKGYLDLITGQLSVGEANVVFTTGDQTIIGNKTFLAPIQAYRINDTGSAGGTTTMDCTDRTLLDAQGNDTVHFGINQLHNTAEGIMVDWNSGVLASNGTQTVNWVGLQLSGDWQTNTFPTIPKHLINLGYLTGVSGYIVGLIQAASAGVASINGTSGILTLGGAGNISIITVGQTITVSGATTGFVQASQTGNFLITGNERCFTTTITTGFDTQFINITPNFSSIPKILCTVEMASGVGYFVNTSGISISGFTACFSDIIRESGVVLHTLVKV